MAESSFASLPLAYAEKSWFIVSAWSFLVLPLPIPLSFRRDSEGKTSMGGVTPFLYNSRERMICPSVMYPVKSGMGWVLSSSGMVRMGICVMDPFLPRIRPALS